MGSVICVAEDDPFIRSDAVELLASEGFSVEHFPSADDAYRFLSEHAMTVFMLFTDVRMPGSLDGIALSHIVAVSWPWVRILVTSGTTAEIEPHLPAKAKFLRKPWQHEHVLAFAR